MIIYALLSVLVVIIGLLLSVLDAIPGVDSLNAAIEPYIQSLVTVIDSGANLISFFVPISLLKILIPVVITIELVVDNFDIIKFVFKKILGH